jgi:hypothetical protein
MLGWNLNRRRILVCSTTNGRLSADLKLLPRVVIVPVSQIRGQFVILDCMGAEPSQGGLLLQVSLSICTIKA